jgi:hypothetical protein
MYSFTLFLDLGTRRGEGSASLLGRFLPPGKTRYPLCRRLGGPHGRCGQVRNVSPPPGFDPRTVHPVASRYTDWATRTTFNCYIFYSNVGVSSWRWRYNNVDTCSSHTKDCACRLCRTVRLLVLQQFSHFIVMHWTNGVKQHVASDDLALPGCYCVMAGK